jgi:glycosyltransferase involved in cell wall biosynthesis
MDIIVVDDGSTDSTRTVLERYGSRIKLLVQPNAGVSAACNAAVRLSSSEYLAFLDADDVWLPGRVAKTVAALLSNRQAQLAFTDYLIGQDLGAALDVIAFDGSPSLDEMLRLWMPIARSAVTMRRETFERCGGFPEGVRWGEDMYLWLRTREQGAFEYIREPLTFYRRNTSPGGEQRYPLEARKRFERLVLKRFGDRANSLIRDAREQFAGVLLNSALRQLQTGDKRGALRSCAVLLRSNPLYLIRRGNLIGRAARKNLVRLFAMLTSKNSLRQRPKKGISR